MPNICRIGDTNQAGGAITSGATNVYANGKLLGLQGSPISSHGKRSHRHASVTVGSPTVFANGKPVARVTSGNSCGHSMAQGSPDVSSE